jgi:MEMO1 family protein
LEYLNSGDVKTYGDRQQVVGYWSIACFSESSGFYLSNEEQTELLEKARTSIAHFLKTGERDKITPSLSNGILNDKTGAFVSIYVNHKLRGCIGGFAQEKSLNEMVQSMSVSAVCDLRFDNLKEDELENMELEISVLSPLKKIESVNEIKLGKHGIYIKNGFNSGTFLPQVATKTGWDLEDFLGHCSRDKAGLGWTGWKKAEIYIYEAFIFRG